MMTKEGSTKIVNFMTPGQGFLWWGVVIYSHIVKMHYFFKNLLLYSSASSRQTEYIVMMSKEASTKIVNFMTPGAGVPVMGCGHIWSYSENASFWNRQWIISLCIIKIIVNIVINVSVDLKELTRIIIIIILNKQK